MNALKQKEIYTVGDILALPEGERAELIDGRIYGLAAPSRTHQKISMLLSGEISAYIRKNNGTCEVYAAPFAVFLNNDDLNYFEPDLCVVCDTSKLDEKGCHGAPDWIVEIVSQASRQMDYYRKLFRYREAGVREYWIVDPDKNRVVVYNFERDTMEEYPFGAGVPVGIWEEFLVAVQ